MHSGKVLIRELVRQARGPALRARRHAWAAGNTVASPYAEVDIPNVTLCDYVWQNLDRWPQRTATVCAVTGRGYSYEQAFKLSNRFAANLRTKFKIFEGDTVAVMLPNLPDFPLVVMGILEAGGVVTTMNPVYTAYEVKRQLTLSRPKLIVTVPQVFETVKKAMQMANVEMPIIVIKESGEATPEGAVLFSELAEDVHVDTACLKQVQMAPSDVCLLPYSSGTTGLPKGVELSHRNLIANCQQINEEAISSHFPTTSTHQDAILTVLPFFHIYAISVIMFHKMSHGGKIVTLPKFHPETYLQALHKQKTNILFAAPPLIILMATHPLARPEQFARLQLIINGAAPLAPADAQRFFDKAQRTFDFRQGYGLTETSPVVTMMHKGEQDYASVGAPIPNTQVRVVDEQLRALGPNQTGELLVKGPQVMRGYRDNAEATAASFTPDGWFRTGDLAVVDARGVATIAGRLKELIKVKGFQVLPAELEGVLREHPGVADAAVVGAPHAADGETPRAFVVLRPGAKATPQDLKDFIKERVAPYKRINEMVFLDAIPKSAAGKILRMELQKYQM